MEEILEFAFYCAICLVFSDLAFFIIRKFLKFSESLINTKFDFGKIKIRKSKGV